MNFRDKVVLITGGASGIGKATAIRFAKGGATVVLAGRRKHVGHDTVQEIEALGGRAKFVPTDVTSADQLSALHDLVASEYGCLDIAFNNAGFQERCAKIEEHDLIVFDEVFDTNVRAVFNALQHQIRIMKAQGRGAIVINTSVSGMRNPNPGISIYSASKAAVISLVRSAAVEVAGDGIRINAVAPGRVLTDMMRRSKIMETVDVAATLPLRRMGKPEEVAEVVAWLSSDASSYVIGQIVCADGGFMAS